MKGGGEHAPGARDAVTVASSPPEMSAIDAGETTGEKPAGATFTMKLAVPNGPPESLARTFTIFCPGRAPARARTSKASVWAGGMAPTGIEDGVILSSDGRAGKVTVGDPV